jgi:glutathione S-transferase
MMKLFYAPGACSLAPHILLEEAGAAFETARLDLSKGEQRRPEYLAVNPEGRVPFLTTARGGLSQNVAISLHIAETHPQAGLIPADPWVKAQAVSWLVWLSGTVHGTAFAAYFRAARFADGEEAQAAVKAKSVGEIANHFTRMEQHLTQSGEYAFGAFSVADPMMLVLRRWGIRIGLDMAAYPHLAAHANRIAARPGAARAIATEGIRIDG